MEGRSRRSTRSSQRSLAELVKRMRTGSRGRRRDIVIGTQARGTGKGTKRPDRDNKHAVAKLGCN